MAAWNSLGGMKAPAEDEDVVVQNNARVDNGSKTVPQVEPEELDILSAFWVALGGDPLAAEITEGGTASQGSQAQSAGAVSPAPVMAQPTDTPQGVVESSEPTQRIPLVLPTTQSAELSTDGTLIKPAAVLHLKKTAQVSLGSAFMYNPCCRPHAFVAVQSLRAQVRKEIACKRKVILKLQHIAAPIVADALDRDAHILAEPPTPADARPEGAGAMPSMHVDVHTQNLTAAVAALSQPDDVQWLEKLHNLEISAVIPEVVQAAPKEVSSSLKALSCTTSLLQLAEAEDRALEHLLERITQGFIDDKAGLATARQELVQKQQTLLKMESQTVAQLTAAEDRSAEILREIDVKLDVLASEQAAFKVQQTNIVAMGGRSGGDVSPGVEASRQATEAAELLAQRKAVELSRLRAETLGVQPWTLALSLRRWHQPNSSTYQRKLLLTEWLVAIQEWHANNVSADAVLSLCTVPAFVGINRIRSAMHASIDLLIGDLR
jgi:hypothetical protein